SGSLQPPLSPRNHDPVACDAPRMRVRPSRVFGAHQPELGERLPLPADPATPEQLAAAVPAIDSVPSPRIRPYADPLAVLARPAQPVRRAPEARVARPPLSAAVAEAPVRVWRGLGRAPVSLKFAGFLFRHAGTS